MSNTPLFVATVLVVAMLVIVLVHEAALVLLGLLMGVLLKGMR